MLPSTDEALMERVQEGNIQAFDALYERYSARIHAFLLRRTGDREGAAELHQDTFLRIWRHRASYRAGSPFRPWMYGIAANAARDRLRAQARRPEQLMALPPEHPAAPPSGDERDLEAAIFALPDNLREAFLLGAIEGLDHNEVAEALGIRPDNARARISRARASLRKALGVDT
jgi:RNA polymerase sigma factor (sigma-70 family)